MKHITRLQPVYFWLLLLCLFTTLWGTAQTHTPKYVSMCSKSKAYYEYLPQGYDPNGTTTYPLILFMTGIGEFGSGSSGQLPFVLKWGVPKLINDGKFPASFTAGGQTHRFIVITPQFLRGSEPKAEDMNTVLDYIVAHYKVNLNRIYITGLSYGGGLSFAYAGRSAACAARVAAIVPVASPIPLPIETGYDTIYARSRIIAAGNVPVWATHNSGDTPDSVSRTTAYIDDINQAPAPNPLAKKTIFNAGGHDAWTKTYDPNFREFGYNVYEWMLLHQKGSPPPGPNTAPAANAGADKTITLPTNSVTLTGSGTDSDGSIVAYNWIKVSGPTEGTIVSPTAATTTLTGLAQGIYTFRLMVSDNVSAKGVDDVKVTVKFAPGTKAIQVNIYGGSSAYSNTAWNNWNVGTALASNVTSAAFKYFDGTTSSVSAVLSRTLTVSDNGSTYGSGMAPAEVLRHTSYDSVARMLTIQGLSAAKTYKLELYASRNSTTAGSTRFTVNGTPITINTVNNLDGKAVFSNATPDASGQLIISVDKLNTYSYLNGFTIIENAVTAPPTTKYIKGNIYGGTNPYNNAQWNDWDVKASKTFNALKYSDGTTSAVNTVLSASTAIADNGASYGGTMAPPEVLRYGSYSASLRTLTFSGLSTSNTYNLELYASRANTGNSSIFTVGSTTITIVSDNNKTNAASFTSLVPNSSGQIVVSINKSGTYSYLNGFILTENSGSGPATAMSPNTVQEEALAVNATGKTTAKGVSVSPNPAASRVLLTLNNSYKGALQVQVVDAAGKSQKSFRYVKTSPVLQQFLPMNGLSKGIYFITVQMGAQRQTIPVSKF